MSRSGFALFGDPIFKIELLAYDFKSLIENFAGSPIRSGPDGQVDHALLFRLQLNCRHAASPFNECQASVIPATVR